MPPRTSDLCVCTGACKPYAIQLITIIQCSKEKKKTPQNPRETGPELEIQNLYYAILKILQIFLSNIFK